ncbi:MAG TPA: PEP-CTERM sorting domain-containing protein [Burkholderiales bacterium]|nr:PEP-CTERM sorting domain-containing protein [Burkholderiales bacterium]
MKYQNLLGLLLAATVLPASAQSFSAFTAGDIVVSVEGNGVYGAASGPYTDNQAAPLTLFEFSTTGTSGASFAGSMVLPQTSSGSNWAISGEYGSSSEGTLQLSGNGQYLTIMGYGVNAATFNANPTAYGTTVNDPTKPTALGQSGSLTGQSYIAVPRVVALIGANGSVDTSTALYGVFNGNNPRSVYTVDGSSFYVSGQGNSPDATGGVFYATRGSSTATAITGLDTNSKSSSQDTRDVQVHNGQLYVSVDSKEGSGNNRDFIGTLGSAGSLPTSLANSGNGPTQLSGFASSNAGKLTVTAANENTVNASVVGQTINLSPENFFFASSSVLYVADSGAPKNNSGSSTLGDGGLQKWVNSKADGTGTWTLEYTLSSGLNLVANTSASGTTGLLGLTGEVVGGSVELFATNYTVGDIDQTYLFGITDSLAATSLPSGETFSILATAPADSNFKGVSLAPVPEPATYGMLVAGLGLLWLMIRRRAATISTVCALG